MRESSRAAVLAVAVLLAACGSPGADGPADDALDTDDTSSGERQDSAPDGLTTTPSASASAGPAGTGGPDSTALTDTNAVQPDSSSTDGSDSLRATTSRPPSGGGGGTGSGSPPSPTTAAGQPAPPASRQPQTITFAPPSTPWRFGEEQTLQARSSSQLPLTYAAAGVCTLTDPVAGRVRATGVGSCELTVAQGGDQRWAAATPVSHSVTISQATPAVRFGSRTVEYQQTPFDLPLEATSTSGATPSYSVTFDEGGACGLSGAATLHVEITDGGLPKTCEVKASFAATSEYTAATASATVTIEPTVVTIVAARSSSDGSGTVSVTLNRTWAIDVIDPPCVVSGALDGLAEYQLRLEPIPCTVTIEVSFKDATHTVERVTVSAS